MVNTAIHTFLIDSQEALAIWATLTIVALAAFTALAATARREWSGVARAGAGWARRRRAGLAGHAADRRRYADEIAVAAQRAARTARRRHDEWAAAQTSVGTAWTAFDTADARHRRTVLAASIPVPPRPLTPSDVSVRERHMHRAATEAFHRGDLSIDQLFDALASRNGWNPCRDPADQELIIGSIARYRRLQTYLSASAMERVAGHNAHIATSARRSLDDEAFTAEIQARQAYIRLAREVPQHRRPRAEPRLPWQRRRSLATVAVGSAATAVLPIVRLA
ncbi:MAG: hypothetical protein HKP61_09655 [Dactylosporangium sp.]|nr:hypothetical protein [Dactylosporangium sp.]NNJ61197.1 hypothetical protein [Dactylosporangium sp.]